MRAKIVATARSFIGCRESDGSHKKIIDIYNTITPLPAGYKLRYNDAWCAGFVSAVAQVCDMTDIVYPECGCDRMIALYKAKGRWEERDAYIPSPGDVIFYDWQDKGSGDNTGSSDHVGIVEVCSDGYLTVIEGNISDMVGRRKIRVDAQYIRGYGLPKYSETADIQAEEKPTVVAPTAPQSEKTCTLTLKQLSEGSKSDMVEAAQILLIGYGFRCGVDGHDGEFGPNTLKATKKYQDDRGLTADGIIGPATWKSLLGIK